MVLFRISRKEQFRICKGDEDCASPMWQGKGSSVYREELELERAVVNTQSLVFHLLSPCWERGIVFLLPVGLFQCVITPLSDLSTLFNWSFCLLFFLQYQQRFNTKIRKLDTVTIMAFQHLWNCDTTTENLIIFTSIHDSRKHTNATETWIINNGCLHFLTCHSLHSPIYLPRTAMSPFQMQSKCF